MRYRKEIDGLRAVAVVPVILFHAGVSMFSGGFVGVDIFFVISGYLITTILVTELEADTFSIVRFYERRARRILPALFAVMLVCIPAAWLWMLPNQFREFGQSLAAVTLFGSNILFWMQTGYFATDAELRPLLHTWSLAVEEQYYLLFPIGLWLVWRLGRNRVMWLVAACAAISLGLSEYASHSMESANFYLAPTRAWELLAGALCAFALHGRPAWSKQAPSLIGLALIVFSIFAFNELTPFPGLYALAPVGGTALIILFAGGGTWVARLLSTGPFVGIGLVSYSAYLWHQPLLAFARLDSLTEPSPALMAVLAVAALPLAWLTWHYVERPFRGSPPPLLPRRVPLFIASGLAGGAMIAIGLAIAFLHPPTLIELRDPERIAAQNPPAAAPAPYFACPGFTDSRLANCRRFGDGPRRIVIWGDSHAVRLGDGAQAVPGATVYVLGHWGCPPLIGVAREDRFGNAHFCDRFGVIDGYERYVESLRPDQVYLVARWTMYAHGRHVQSRLQRDSHFITDGRAGFSGARSSTEVLDAALVRTVRRLAARSRVFVVQQIPDLRDYTPRGLLLLDEAPRARIAAWHEPEARILADAARAGATIVPTHDLLCGPDTCALRIDGARAYRDDNHFTGHAARKLFDRLAAGFAAGRQP